MASLDIYKSVARYYVRLKLEEAAKLAYQKGDEERYLKYQKQLKKLRND
ncbi:MAG: hypothetical protein ACI8SR_000552 [Oceanicoccus sp.]|jgi:hypothetical protein